MLSRWMPVVFAAALSALSPASQAAPADDAPTYGPRLEGFDYPAPVKLYKFESQGNALEMAYLDIEPRQPNGQVAVLLHGKNFCAATWEGTIAALAGAGYRVIAPDQVGFCKSSKPRAYQYSFQQLASNTHALLASLGIRQAIVIGHSTGGMLATRYALMYPAEVSRLVMVNPIGLEDWKAKGVPPMTVDQWYAREKQTTADRIRAYEQSTYYAGQWRADYEPWVQMLAGMYRGPGRDLFRTAVRHDLHPAGGVRIRPAAPVDAAADRAEGHHGHRQGHRAAGRPRATGQLPGTGPGHRARDSARHADRVSRCGPCATDPGSCRAAQGPAGMAGQSGARAHPPPRLSETRTGDTDCLQIRSNCVLDRANFVDFCA